MYFIGVNCSSGFTVTASGESMGEETLTVNATESVSQMCWIVQSTVKSTSVPL